MNKAEHNKYFHHLCNETGKHDWVSTTVPNFRKCRRYGCRAAQRFDGKDWIDHTGSTIPRQVTAPTQLNMWSL